MAASLCLLTVLSSCKDIDSLFRAEHQRTEHTSVPIAGVAGLNVETDVGSIEFTAPPQLSAQVHASTNVGSVKTAKLITVVGNVGKSIKGTTGSGEGKVLLKTNVGSIEIN